MVGVLGSLVSITAICGVVRPGESLAIGFIGSAISILGWQLLSKLKIDDPVGAVPTHAGGSIWGMLAVGLFVEKDTLENTFSSTYGAFKGGHVKILGVQLLACVSITVWTVITVFMQLYIIEKSVGLRFPLEEEILGADACEHGIDQSQARPENRVRPVTGSQNRVFPIGEDGHIGEADSNPQKNPSARNGTSKPGSDDTRLQDCEESATESISELSLESIPGYDKTTHRKQHSSFHEAENNFDPNSSGNVFSSRKRWDKVLQSTRKVSFSEKNGDRDVPNEFSQPKVKVPVVITLTPADDSRELRLSLNDMRKLTK